MSGKKYYIWFILDPETCFVLDFHLSPYRDSNQAFTLLNSVKDLGTVKSIVSDRYSAYKVPVKSVQGEKVSSFSTLILCVCLLSPNFNGGYNLSVTSILFN